MCKFNAKSHYDLSPLGGPLSQCILSGGGGDSISLVQSIPDPDILSLRASCVKTPRKSVSHMYCLSNFTETLVSALLF